MQINWDIAVERRQAYGLVIVGAGPAGLYLAQRLSGSGNILVLDAGTTENPLGDGHGYYELTVSGRPYPVIGSRLSALGGSSNHWGGNTHRLSPGLFQTAAPDAWPIGYGEFSPFLADAARFLNVPPPTEDGGPTSLETGVFSDYQDVEVTRFALSTPMARFGEPGALSAFEALEGVDILADARATDLELNGERVSSVTVLNRSSRQTLTLTPQTVILAMGGIENARFLLWAGRNLPKGNPFAGGPNGLTGAYFTERPYFSPVDMFVDARANLIDAIPHGDDHGYLAWTVSDAFRERHDLRRVAVFPGPATPVQSNPDLAAIGTVYAQQSSSYLHLVPTFQFEQTAHRGSYVALDRSIADDDGIARAELHWEILPDDIAAYRRSVLLFCGLLNQKGYARSRMRTEHLPDDWSKVDLGYCNHHEGTTRMASTNAEGVVDPDCRVFGVSNLYVAGSSVFPSSGFANPTLNLVALAGRLADHLKARAS